MLKGLFDVISHEITINRERVSIIRDAKGIVYKLPINLIKGKVELEFKIDSSGQVLFNLSIFDYNLLESGTTIICEVIRTYIKNDKDGNEKKFFFVSWNGLALSLPFIGWQYCRNYEIPKQLSLEIANRNGETKRLIQKITPENKHPYFLENNEYLFDFIGYKETASKRKLILLTDEYNGIYQSYIQFNQTHNDFKSAKVKCIFLGYDRSSNVFLKQSERKLLTLKDVLKVKMPLIMLELNLNCNW